MSRGLVVLLLGCLLVASASAQCSTLFTVANSTTDATALFSLPVGGLCDSPTLDYYCSIEPPSSGVPLSVTVRLLGPKVSTILCSWSSLTGSTVSDNGTLTRCDDILLNGDWSISVEGSLADASSTAPWSFSVSLATPPAALPINSTTSIIAGPGIYRTYAVNLTATNGTQEVNFVLSGDITRFLPVALWGDAACPVGDNAYTWRGNSSSASFSVAGVLPGVYYLTLVQNERIPFAATQLFVNSTQAYAPPAIPSWWYWSAGVIVLAGVASMWVLLDAMQRPLGTQRSRI